MAKQSLIYESAVPLPAYKHGKVGFDATQDYAPQRRI